MAKVPEYIYQEIVAMREDGEFTWDQIGAALGQTGNTVRHRYYRYKERKTNGKKYRQTNEPQDPIT